MKNEFRLTPIIMIHMKITPKYVFNDKKITKIYKKYITKKKNLKLQSIMLLCVKNIDFIH